jgi:uncharacterized protein YndB with AHSA1/START domain
VAEPSSAVALRRLFSAPPEKVFRAFTDPALLAHWFSPGPEIATRVLEHDLRVGGRYRFAFRFQDGTERVVQGEFLEVLRPQRVVFTWTWEEPDPHAGIETQVSIVITAADQGTELVVTHDRFPDESTRVRHHEGWSTTLDRLAELLLLTEGGQP